MSKFIDLFVDTIMTIGLPFISCYLILQSNLFLMTANIEATGLEKLGNDLLKPCHYLFVGKIAERDAKEEWVFTNQFQYEKNFAIRTVLSSILLLPSVSMGSCVKALSYFNEATRERHESMKMALLSTQVNSNLALYQSLGIQIEGEKEWANSLGFERRPGDDQVLKVDKDILGEVGILLDNAQIPWWLDCGTCLGAYRYGGIIPWDEDLDIAVLRPDFDNIRRLLNHLDPKKYLVEDWSSRTYPKSYLRIYVRDSGNRYDKRIDIYHFDIHPESKTIRRVVSNEHNLFMTNSWKAMERLYKVPAPIGIVFPLKKAAFDGIEVNVPSDTKKYLERYYGPNLAPVRLFNPKTNQYEKDLSHPYWKMGFTTNN